MVHSRRFALPNLARLMRCFLHTAYGLVLVRFSTGQVGCLLGLKEVWICAEGPGSEGRAAASWSGAIKSQYSNEPAMAPNQCVKNG